MKDIGFLPFHLTFRFKLVKFKGGKKHFPMAVTFSSYILLKECEGLKKTGGMYEK